MINPHYSVIYEVVYLHGTHDGWLVANRRCSLVSLYFFFYYFNLCYWGERESFRGYLT